MRGPLLLLAALAAPLARADITSAFDAGAEGWKAANVSLTTLAPNGEGLKDVTWNASAGNIGASESLFAQPGAFVLLAPAKFRGDLSAYAGGTASFRLADATRDAGIVQPNLLLVGLDASGNRLAIGYPTVAPSASGTLFAIPLVRTGWITSTGAAVTPAQFDGVLKTVLGFGIDADWTTATTDVVTLDDVRVAAAPVPEPATLAGLAAGALLLARRRRSR